MRRCEACAGAGWIYASKLGPIRQDHTPLEFFSTEQYPVFNGQAAYIDAAREQPPGLWVGDQWRAVRPERPRMGFG